MCSHGLYQVNFHDAVPPLSHPWPGDGDSVEFVAEVAMILAIMLHVGYKRWKFRLVSTAFCSIGNGIGIICSRLVFDRVLKVQLTEKAPDLFVPLHVVPTTDCRWTLFILIAVYCHAPYCVLLSIHGDSNDSRELNIEMS